MLGVEQMPERMRMRLMTYIRVTSLQRALLSMGMVLFVEAYTRDSFVYAPSQWETTLLCSAGSHWLGAYTHFFCNIRLGKRETLYVYAQLHSMTLKGKAETVRMYEIEIVVFYPSTLSMNKNSQHWFYLHGIPSRYPKGADSSLFTWWRHQMETFFVLLAICAGNSPVPGEFPTQRPVTRSFDVYFDLRPNKRLSKQSLGWWFETLSPPLWRHRNELSAKR